MNRINRHQKNVEHFEAKDITLKKIYNSLSSIKWKKIHQPGIVKDSVEKILDYFPFFVKWPIQTYYNLYKEGIKRSGIDRAIIFSFLFIWFVFVKKTVRINLEDSYRIGGE